MGPIEVRVLGMSEKKASVIMEKELDSMAYIKYELLPLKARENNYKITGQSQMV